jgi:hypothetical protein
MILNEGLDYHDMKGQIHSTITVDEYSAKMGKDSEIVTVTFTTNSKLAAKDLVNWLEIGYDFVLDASVSDGEVEPGKWLVFVEMKRKYNVPEKIIKILKDLETLTDIDLKDWDVTVNDNEYNADADILTQIIILSPREYRQKKESEKELNEYRQIAGLDIKTNPEDIDEEIRSYLTNAGL